ncbi:hypothetical protein M513_08788 [Trichuris suis]|uniref:Uncharacterized protein n=1 Tax=Trichuris suis TaxID=68888 RepID=A0A085LZ92_9BILA|nr:hypothetical protein M513_08788 [Trichuris suis]
MQLSPVNGSKTSAKTRPSAELLTSKQPTSPRYFHFSLEADLMHESFGKTVFRYHLKAESKENYFLKQPFSTFFGWGPLGPIPNLLGPLPGELKLQPTSVTVSRDPRQFLLIPVAPDFLTAVLSADISWVVGPISSGRRKYAREHKTACSW